MAAADIGCQKPRPGRRLSAGWTAAGIFLLAMCLRMAMVPAGLPYIHYWDETTYIKITLRMLHDGNFDHNWYRIPPFFLYQHVAVQSLRLIQKARQGDFRSIHDAQIDERNRELSDRSIVVWSRAYTALLGSSICVMLYLTLLMFMQPRTAALAGVFLAAFHGHIEHSALIVSDIPMSFWVILTVMMCYRWSSLSPGQCFWLGISSGLAAASKYPGAAAVFVPIAFISTQEKKQPLCFPNLFAGCLCGFTAGYPYWIARYPLALTGLAQEVDHYYGFVIATGETHNHGMAFLSYLFTTGIGPLLFLTILPGAVFIIRGMERTPALRFWIFPAVYGVWVLSQKSGFVRNLTPLMPWFAACAAAGVSGCWERCAAWFGEKNAPLAKKTLSMIVALGILFPSCFWLIRIHSDTEPRVRAVDGLQSITNDNSITGIPYDLHFLYEELERLDGSVVLLGQSNVHEQTRTGLDFLVLGATPWKKNGWDYENYETFLSGLKIWKTISRSRAYAPRSSMGALTEGRWRVDNYSVNPELLLAENPADASWEFIPPTVDSYSILDCRYDPPVVDRLYNGKSLAVGKLGYKHGLCAHLQTKLSFPVPEGAERFVMDAGFVGKVSQFAPLPYTVRIKTSPTEVYEIYMPSSPSAVCRADVPVYPNHDVIVHVPDYQGRPEIEVVLGLCQFAMRER